MLISGFGLLRSKSPCRTIPSERSCSLVVIGIAVKEGAPLIIAIRKYI